MSMFEPEILTVIGIGVALATIIPVTTARTNRRIDTFLAERANHRRALQSSMDDFRKEMRRLAEPQAHVEGGQAGIAPAEWPVVTRPHPPPASPQPPPDLLRGKRMHADFVQIAFSQRNTPRVHRHTETSELPPHPPCNCRKPDLQCGASRHGSRPIAFSFPRKGLTPPGKSP